MFIRKKELEEDLKYLPKQGPVSKIDYRLCLSLLFRSQLYSSAIACSGQLLLTEVDLRDTCKDILIPYCEIPH